MQGINIHKGKIEALLMSLEERHGINERTAERLLGYSPKYFGKAKGGHTTGPEKIAAALEILLRLEDLKQKQKPPSIEDQIRAIVRDELERLNSRNTGENDAVDSAHADDASKGGPES